MKKIKHTNTFRKIVLFSICLMTFAPILAQENRGQLAKKSKEFMQEAEEALAANNFPMAEAYYRRAIATDSNNVAASYNLGNIYFNKKIIPEAAERHSQAAKSATTEPLKHKAFHNRGNAFMKQKQYKKAIEAYKNALRNNPEDDETRYNLALAKKLLEEQKKKGGGGGDKNNKNKDQKKKDQKEGQGDQKKNDQGKPKDQNQGKDQKPGEDQKKKENKEGDKGEPKKEKPQDQGKQKPQQQKPVPGQLSPQQIKNLMEAMSNQEEKVREKVNARKEKGSRVQTEKDW